MTNASTQRWIDKLRPPKPVVASSITGQMGAPTPAPQPVATQNVAPSFIGQPAKKVATTQNPVLTRSATPPAPMTPPATDITNRDDNKIKDYIAWAELNPTQLDETARFNMTRGAQILADRSYQQQNVDPRKAQVTSAEQQLKEQQAKLAERDTQLADARRKELELTYGKRIAGEQEVGAKTMDAAQGVLSFSGFGRSTYAAEKQAEIQSVVNENISILNAERDLAMRQYEAELAGATAEELAGYNEMINAYRMKSAEYSVQLAQQMNEYNAQTAASYQERVGNILNLANSMQVTELTPAQQEEASAYATLLLDDKGNINEKLLADIPPMMKGAALKKAAELKGQMPKKAPETISGPQDSVWRYVPETDSYEKVIDGAEKKTEWKDNGLGEYYRTNPITGDLEQWNGSGVPPSSSGGGGGQGPSTQGTTNTTDLIKKREGFRENAYLDPVGIPTIGYGFTSVNGKPVQLGQTMSRAEADVMLQDKIQEYSNWRNFVSADLSPSQEAALTSFEFNLGKGIRNKNAMGILEDINKGNLQSAAKKMQAYVNAGGKMLPGLANRRREEAQLLMTPKEFDLMKDAPAQGKEYTQSQKNLLVGLKDKTLGKVELSNLKKQGLEPQDVYDYNASQKGLELTDDQRSMYTNQISNFRGNEQVKAFEEGMSNYENIAASLDDASGVGDMAGVFQFMKSLDPRSVVRKEEFDSAAGSAGVFNQLGNTWERLSEAKILTPDQAKAFKKLAKKYIDNKAKSYDRLYGDMERALTNSKIDPSYFPTKASNSLKTQEIKPYNASIKYVSGDTFTKDGKKYVVGVDGNAYEQ